MIPPTPEPGFLKEVVGSLAKVLEIFTKPLKVVSDAVSLRLELWLRRKPKLHVNFHSPVCVWCLAHEGDTKLMQIYFVGDFNHDDPEQTLFLMNAYVKGTKARFPLGDQIEIGPEEIVSPTNVTFMVTPVVGEEGKNWKGKLIFIDQFHREHKTQECEFQWVGGQSLPLRYQ